MASNNQAALSNFLLAITLRLMMFVFLFASSVMLTSAANFDDPIPVRPDEASSKKVTKTTDNNLEAKKELSDHEAGDEPSAAAPQPTPDPGWEFTVSPYIFMPRLNGNVGALGRTAEVNASFADIFRNLDFAIMGAFEARKGNWMFLGDAMYMSLSGKKITPNPLFGDIEVETKEVIIDPEVGYRVVKGKGGSIDLLAGVRFSRVKTHITFQPRINPQVDVEDTKTWADPVIGARFIAHLSPKVFATAKLDAGGFGIASDATGQAFGGVGFQVTPKVALVGGYRYLYVNYLNEGFTFRTSLSGILLGAKFSF